VALARRRRRDAAPLGGRRPVGSLAATATSSLAPGGRPPEGRLVRLLVAGPSLFGALTRRWRGALGECAATAAAVVVVVSFRCCRGSMGGAL
jgi:hypothetical protein